MFAGGFTGPGPIPWAHAEVTKMRTKNATDFKRSNLIVVTFPCPLDLLSAQNGYHGSKYAPCRFRRLLSYPELSIYQVFRT